MSNLIGDVLQEFKIQDKLVAVTTDNASAMVSLVKNFLKVLHVRCFAHTLNLIVKDSIKASAELNHLVGAVKKVVNFFHKSAKATAKLKSTIGDLGLPQLKLCQDVETRWNATLKMLRRYCELHRPVTGALMALGKSELIISDQKVEEMRHACECLEPFEEATEMMSTEKSTSLSKILVVVRQLQLYLTTEARKCQLTSILIKSLSERFPSPEENFSGAASTLLNPRFKRVPFSDNAARLRHEEKIINMMRPLFVADDKQEQSHAVEIGTTPPAKKQKSFMQSFVERVKKIDDAMP
ncbi:Zinc finger bed domain-containing protein 4 [Plakobranchus ocellatus]|uniref:Zinc finger bed domain-containing protein 4 n=1 Tax=Plakobranchus ocellatus TaxID=259542 RepID=A0AAV4BDL6_9GAST|nr:Zinc finger bed domain-containing protein 4 [Plakobranchus ocellatus]